MSGPRPAISSALWRAVLWLVPLWLVGPALAQAPQPPAPQAPVPQAGTIQHVALPAADGSTRSYSLVLPEKPMPGKLPLVLLLHGAIGNADTALVSFGFRDLAASGKLIAIAPNGTRAEPTEPANDWRRDPPLWNDGSGRGAVAKRFQTDDVSFLADLISETLRRHPADPDRVYVAGFAEGGSMALRLAAERSDLVAAVASVAGTMWIKPPRLVRPFPVLVMVGENDPVNPWIGGAIQLPWEREPVEVPPLVETLERWAQALTCVGGVKRVGPHNGVIERRYGPCLGDVHVAGLVIEQHGHRWPGAAGDLMPPAMVGPATPKVDATRTIWSFFEPARRKPPIRYPGRN